MVTTDPHEDQTTAEVSAQDGTEFAANACAEAVEAEADHAEVNGYRNDEIVETDGTLDDDERIELERASGMSRMESKRAGGYTPPLTRAHQYPHDTMIRDIALAYARSGLHVFPCNPSGDRAKQPITKNGFKDAATDPDKIWRWYTQFKSALIGLRTGRTSGVLVVDLDNKNGVNGIAELEKLEAKHGKLSETYTVITPSGGKHLYFDMPDIDLGCSASRVGPGIDIRAEGGYVIAPPSMLGDGRTYESVDNGFDITGAAKAPDWLIKLAMAKRKRKARTPLDRSVAEIKPRNWVQKILDAECAVVAEAEKKTRNDTLNKAAFRLGQLIGQKALTREEAEDALYEAARECGLLIDAGGEDAVLATLNSGLAAGQEAAREHPLFPDRHPDSGIALKDSIDNVRALLSFLGVTMKFNRFAYRTDILGLRDYKLLDDNALLEIWALAHQYWFKASRDHLAGALTAIGLENAYHPVRDYFDSLHWDGVERLDEWLVTYAGAEDTEYVRAVGRKTLLAAVRRVRQPGVKHDAMLVLEGPQYAGKSSLFRILAIRDEWFTDNFTLKLADDEKKLIEQTAGCLILEIPELKGLQHSQVETIKAFLSRQVDKSRLSYGRFPATVPRQYIIGGTINPEDDAPYLKDKTGNRRFWPVTTADHIDVASLRRDIDQLWAEAVYLEATGESLELPRHVLAAARVEQEKRVAEDPLVEALDDAFGEMLGRVLTEDVWTLIGKPNPAQREQWAKKALGQAMRKLGWKKEKLSKKEPGSKESRKRYFYTRGAEPYPMIEVIAQRGEKPIVQYADPKDRPEIDRGEI
jgi:hypothetical protein